MPFTPSHIAAILPFARTPLPAAGLVIGSMVPDLPYFIPIGIPREYSHSLIGAVTADLPMAIVVFALWVFVFRAPLLDLSPRWLHDRFRHRPRGRSAVRFSLMLIAAILIGIATHLLWDSFTHPDGLVVLHLEGLRAELGPFTVSRWLQYLSSVFGLVAVGIWSARWARRTLPVRSPYQRTTAVLRPIIWCVVAGVLVAVAAAVWIRGLLSGISPVDRTLLYDTAVYPIAVAGLLAVLVLVGWYFLRKPAAR
jgi:hypothetical protein